MGRILRRILRVLYESIPRIDTKPHSEEAKEPSSTHGSLLTSFGTSDLIILFSLDKGIIIIFKVYLLLTTYVPTLQDANLLQYGY
jgi:hypothetical protein